MLALSIRQPWAELILRGVKKIEYRSRPTRLIGERFYIYAAKGRGTQARRHEGTKGEGKGTEARRHEGTKGRKTAVWSRDLALACGVDSPPPWMLEMMEELLERDLPRGLLVGTAVITRCTGGDGAYEWHLAKVMRLARPMPPARHPQPAWFTPFNRAA